MRDHTGERHVERFADADCGLFAQQNRLNEFVRQVAMRSMVMRTVRTDRQRRAPYYFFISGLAALHPPPFAMGVFHIPGHRHTGETTVARFEESDLVSKRVLVGIVFRLIERMRGLCTERGDLG